VLIFKGKICEPNKRLAMTDTGANTHKFVYFSKAHWLLRRVVGLEEYRQLSTSSIWSQYIGELSEVELPVRPNTKHSSYLTLSTEGRPGS
jgi:hypothetical protein